MSKKSKRKADVKSSILVLLLIAILLIASTYAWFTANKTVTVSSLDVNVQAQNGLQISADGTNWKSILQKSDIDSTNLATTYATNKNQIPTSMEPVSTTGNVTSGELDMFYGNVAAGGTGYVLTATKETDTAGTTGRYIAFDLFLKVDATTQIALTPDSNVKFTDASTKGLENASRVAFLVQGNQPTGTAIGTIQGMSGAESFGTGTTTHIWEPNYDVHTAAGIANAQSTYGKTTTAGPGAAALAYHGVKAEITDGVDITKTETDSTHFAAVDPDYKTTKANADNYNIFTLSPGITKVRIYMWVEGQDVDCENTASGANIQFNLQFTIPD